MGKKRSTAPRKWSATGAARSARDARVATTKFLREAPLAREFQAAKLLEAYQGKVVHLRRQVSDANAAASTAAALLLTGLGYPESWHPEHWWAAADRIVTDQSQALADAELYILSPEMCDVVIAAAQTLTMDDLALLSEEDLPSPSGLVVLPRPLLVRAVNGNLGDERAYQWQAPIAMPKARPGGGWDHTPSVRLTLYHDTNGPVRPDSFLELRRHAHEQKTPLPPLLTDAIRCVPFRACLIW